MLSRAKVKPLKEIVNVVLNDAKDFEGFYRQLIFQHLNSDDGFGLAMGFEVKENEESNDNELWNRIQLKMEKGNNNLSVATE
jgi:hypothetical protein